MKAIDINSTHLKIRVNCSLLTLTDRQL